MPGNFHCQHVPKVSISKVQGVLIKKGSFGGLSPGGAESAPEKWVAAGSPGPAASSRRTPEAHLPEQGRRLRLPEPGPCPERNPSPGAAFADTVGSREAGLPRGRAAAQGTGFSNRAECRAPQRLLRITAKCGCQ